MGPYPHLFSPLRIKDITFRNRIFAVPTQMSYIDGGNTPSDYSIAYFAAKARGGAALVTVGDTPVDSRFAPAMLSHFVLDDPTTLPALSELARAIKEQGAVASIELNHSGQVSQPDYIGGRNPIGPIDHIRHNGVFVQGMNNELMEYTIESFVRAAAFAKLAGFDMCTIHAGHGWLLNQFLSPYFNKRTDQYGGSPENRARFPLAVLEAIRRTMGPDFLLELRVSGEEHINGGVTVEETIDFLRTAKKYIDLVNVSAGLDTNMLSASICHPSIYLPHCCNALMTEKIRKAVDIPIVAVGAIMTAEEGERLVSEGISDAAGMCRALIADPNLPNKARTGASEEIVPCTRCLSCLGDMQRTKQFGCSVNPVTGHEFRLSKIQRVNDAKKIVVIGGGPSGMMAACSAAARGHSVLLLEKHSYLGGMLHFSERDPYKGDLRRYKDYMIRRIMKNPDIEVRLRTEATPELVSSLEPDGVIVALGSVPKVPDISGIDLEHVIEVGAMYERMDRVGKRVTVLGGGISGCDAALVLMKSGHSVTIIEREVSPLLHENRLQSVALLDLLEAGVDIHTSTTCVGITKTEIVISDHGSEDLNIPTDTVVFSVGRGNTIEEAERFRSCGLWFAAVGDCAKVLSLKNAVLTGYTAGVNLIP
jgi:2,4-dienoyl-CoA reductase-like NADH-dependent reductase (Old Yellow Enzyme family)/NADPH-dependent 2,4-dienoyl-CoA reductase/sulfur reductase-like enzyme